MASKTTELAKECRRQEESCLYTSTSFFIWLRVLRTLRLMIVVTSLACGTFAGWKTLGKTDDPTLKTVVALAAFLAALLPALATALKLEKNIEQVRGLAAEFKNLQDRFRQAALIASKDEFDDFDAVVKPLMKRLEEARRAGLTPPEPIFWLAKRKVKGGDYSFTVDEKA